MAWVRLESVFARDPKVFTLSDAAFRLHVAALCWCSEQLTDGVVQESDLRLIWLWTGRRRATARRLAEELVAAGLWQNGSQNEGNSAPVNAANSTWWRIEKYLQYNFSKQQVQAHRESNSARQKAYRERRQPKSNGVTPDVADAVSSSTPYTYTSHTHERTTPPLGSPPVFPAESRNASAGASAAQGGKLTSVGKREATGTRIPEPFPVNEEMKVWFRDNIRNVDGPREHEKFVDYWRGVSGSKGCKKNWFAVWRNWMRRAEEGYGHAGKRKVSTTDARVQEGFNLVQRLMEKENSGSQLELE